MISQRIPAMRWAAALVLASVFACKKQGQTPETVEPSPSDTRGVDGPEPGPATTTPLPDGLTSRGIYRSFETAQAVAVEGADVSMRMLTPYGNELLVASDGAALASGESFTVEVVLRSRQCLNLLYRSGDGSSAVLYPVAEEPACLEPGTHRLPPKGSSYGDLLTLDSNTGEEYLILIASRDPLPKADAELDELVDAVRAGGGKVKLIEASAGASATRGLSISASERELRRERIDNKVKHGLRSRGIVRTRSDGSSIDAKPGDDGVAVLTIVFDHVAP